VENLIHEDIILILRASGQRRRRPGFGGSSILTGQGPGFRSGQRAWAEVSVTS
jgi:hypothetical protein